MWGRRVTVCRERSCDSTQYGWTGGITLDGRTRDSMPGRWDMLLHGAGGGCDSMPGERHVAALREGGTCDHFVQIP